MPVTNVRRRLAHFRNAVAASPLAFIPGHYYSPICDPATIRRWYRNPAAANQDVAVPGIDLRRNLQLDRLGRWRDYMPDIRFPKTRDAQQRYYYGGTNDQYSLGDAIALFCFICELKPKRYIEIGSGFSSACMLDTTDQLTLYLQCTLIDPEPERLKSLLRSPETRSFQLLPAMVQDVPLQTFDQLEAGDILFVDSSHVLKTSSDVEYELFSILPRLRPGVFIHFHDIFYPFEYPAEWAMARNYSWNEIYGLRAFLMYNSRFKIEFWNDYLVKTAPEAVADAAPDMSRHPGGSLWLSVSRGQPP